jgi:hypothetical protein
MQLTRPAFARHPRVFGRGRPRNIERPAEESFELSDDLKLFASTFLIGFLFVSVLIA